MPIADTQKRREYNKEYHSRPEVRLRNNSLARARYEAGGKAIKAEYDRSRRQDPEIKAKRSVYMRQRRWDKWAKVKLGELKVRARNAGVDFNLAEEDLILPDVCPIFGVKFTLGNGSQGNDSPSVDRIVPSLGYVKGNVVVVCSKANRLKGEATIDELKTLVTFYSLLTDKFTPPKKGIK